MALALLKLAVISGEERFRQGAIRAMEYERRAFSPEAQNWPDYRKMEMFGSTLANVPTSENAYMVMWCHGAPGIGLARLASLPYMDNAGIREEIASALSTTLASGFCSNHSLCHGELGNLETLLTAAQILGDQQYSEQVERITAMILASIEKHGWLTGIPMGIESPGLMIGIAGIGYQLLRLAEPAKVPCVLLLAPPITTVSNAEGESVACNCSDDAR